MMCEMTRETAVWMTRETAVWMTRETAMWWDLCVFALCNLSFEEGEDIFWLRRTGFRGPTSLGPDLGFVGWTWGPPGVGVIWKKSSYVEEVVFCVWIIRV